MSLPSDYEPPSTFCTMAVCDIGVIQPGVLPQRAAER